MLIFFVKTRDYILALELCFFKIICMSSVNSQSFNIESTVEMTFAEAKTSFEQAFCTKAELVLNQL